MSEHAAKTSRAEEALHFVAGLFPRRSLLRMGLANLGRRLKYGRITLVFPDGMREVMSGSARVDGDADATIVIRRWRALRRLFSGGTLGFAEAYMDGDWDSPDLTAVIRFAACNEEHLGQGLEGWPITRAINRLAHLRRANTKSGSKKNIAYHYDLGNDFYESWLDQTMTYSSGVFADEAETLEQAQARKYQKMADHLDLQPGARVLEIGCGWGGFARFLAKDMECHVTGISLSRRQLEYARAKVEADGLSDQVDLRFQDYRDVTETYDRIASIEMFEAVGEEHWPKFFDVVRERLSPGGKAVMQIITIDESRFDAYRKSCDFIQRYIFPGGMLPSPQILENVAGQSGLELADQDFFGSSYAETLKRWNDTFQERWPGLLNGKFDGRFKRMWEYYLAYCEGGFRTGAIDVGHFVFQRD